jgi:radical SAM protein with 4Fe4S-binding SPASM domain
LRRAARATILRAVNPASAVERHRVVFDAGAAAAERQVPLTAVVELTRRCNLRCVMCYATPDRARPELTPDRLFDLIDQIHDLGSLYVTFLGGDPTLRREFVPLMRHAARRRLAVQVLTNGLLIDEATADAMAELGVAHVGLTLLGATASTHDRLARRPGAFEGVLRAARLLTERGLNVSTKLLVMRENHDEADAAVALARSLRLPCAVNVSLSPTDRFSAEPWRHRLAPAAYAEAVRRFMPPPRPGPGRDLTCQMARGYMAVNAYGDVLSCISVPIPAGNVRYAPLRTIWEESPFLRSMRALDPMKDLHTCPTCAFRRGCTRCYGSAFTETGDLFGPEPEACLFAAAMAEPAVDPVRNGPPGLSHSDSRFWVVGDILESFGLGCRGA